MNPTTMKYLNLDMGDCILLSSKDKDSIHELILTCWPSSQLEASQIAFNKYYTSINALNFDETKLVLVQKLNKTNISACNQMNIEFMSSLSSGSLFISSKSSKDDELTDDLELVVSFLKETLTNKCVTSKQLVFVQYMGQSLVFKVSSLDKKSAKRKVNDVDSITNQLNETLKFDYNGNKVNEGKVFIESDLKPVKSESFAQNGNGFSLITAKTVISINRGSDLNAEKAETEAVRKYMFRDVGGLEKEIELLKEFFISPFEFGDLYKRIGAVI